MNCKEFQAFSQTAQSLTIFLNNTWISTERENNSFKVSRQIASSANTFWIQNIWDPKFLSDTNFFQTQNFFRTQIFVLYPKFFGPKFFLDPIFFFNHKFF